MEFLRTCLELSKKPPIWRTCWVPSTIRRKDIAIVRHVYFQGSKRLFYVPLCIFLAISHLFLKSVFTLVDLFGIKCHHVVIVLPVSLSKIHSSLPENELECIKSQQSMENLRGWSKSVFIEYFCCLGQANDLKL